MGEQRPGGLQCSLRPLRHLRDLTPTLATSTKNVHPGPDIGTCGGRAQDHRLGLCHAQVPDSIAVAHVLLEQLAQSPGACGGLKAGHNLDMGAGGRETERLDCFSSGVEPNLCFLYLLFTFIYELVCLMCFILLFVINIVGSLFDFSLRCAVLGVGKMYTVK